MEKADSDRYCAVCGKDMQIVVDGVVTKLVAFRCTLGLDEENERRRNFARKQFGVYAHAMEGRGPTGICYECLLKRLGVPQPEEIPRSTDNEKIAEWLGYEVYHPIRGGVWQSMMRKPGGFGIFVPDYERHITLWHGEQGLFKEIEKKGAQRPFYAAWLILKSTYTMCAPWHFRRAEPPELVKALVEMIETTAKEAKNG